jgi:hypothetical protein
MPALRGQSLRDIMERYLCDAPADRGRLREILDQDVLAIDRETSLVSMSGDAAIPFQMAGLSWHEKHDTLTVETQ